MPTTIVSSGGSSVGLSAIWCVSDAGVSGVGRSARGRGSARDVSRRVRSIKRIADKVHSGRRGYSDRFDGRALVNNASVWYRQHCLHVKALIVLSPIDSMYDFGSLINNALAWVIGSSVSVVTALIDSMYGLGSLIIVITFVVGVSGTVSIDRQLGAVAV